MNKKELLPNTTILFIFASISLAMFNIAYSRDTFYIAGYLSIIYFFTNINKQTIISNALPLSILLLGLSKIIWSMYYEPSSSNFSNVYNSYFDVGKRLVISSFLVSFAINADSVHKEKLTNIIRLVMPFVALAIAVYSAYQFHILGLERTELSTNRATATAYMLTPVLLLSLFCCIKEKTSLKNIIFLALVFVACLYSILLTQTRAAILSFTFIALLMLAFKLSNKIRNIVLLSLVSIISVITIINYDSMVKPRATQAITEVMNFDQTKDNGSLGNRFTMWIAGTKSAYSHPLGQSAEQRYKTINEQIEKKYISPAISQFIDVHLHSEFIDTLSLQGIAGCLALILFYLFIIKFSLKEKNYLLLSISLTIILYGLSDVLFFSQEVAVTYMSALALAIMIGNQHENSSL